MAMRLVVLALLLAGCDDAGQARNYVRCTTDGVETFRSPRSPWVARQSSSGQYILNDHWDVYTPKPGEICGITRDMP